MRRSPRFLVVIPSILLVSTVVAVTPALAGPAQIVEREIAVQVAPGVTLGCTTTLPSGQGPFAGAVLLSVAGPNDRDQSVFAHRGFRDLAHGLAAFEIATLRCDDRGVGASTGDLLAVTYDELAAEAALRLAALAALPEVDPERVGFVGNSEGGAIGPLTASRNDQVAFVVLLAGPGRSGAETLRLQLESPIVTLGVEAERAESLRVRYERFLEIQARDPADPETRTTLRSFLENGGQSLFPPYSFVPRDLDGLTDYLLSPWHRSMIAHDPVPVPSGLELPVLALAGDKDRALDPEVHLESIRSALAGNAQAAVEILPGLNHLFQTAGTGSPLEYALLPESISPLAVTRVGEWIAAFFPPREL